jgi:hypothetical protein
MRVPCRRPDAPPAPAKLVIWLINSTFGLTQIKRLPEAGRTACRLLATFREIKVGQRCEFVPMRGDFCSYCPKKQTQTRQKTNTVWNNAAIS